MADAKKLTWNAARSAATSTSVVAAHRENQEKQKKFRQPRRKIDLGSIDAATRGIDCGKMELVSIGVPASEGHDQ